MCLRGHHGAIMSAIGLDPETKIPGFVFAELGIGEEGLQELSGSKDSQVREKVRFMSNSRSIRLAQLQQMTWSWCHRTRSRRQRVDLGTGWVLAMSWMNGIGRMEHVHIGVLVPGLRIQPDCAAVVIYQTGAVLLKETNHRRASGLQYIKDFTMTRRFR